MADTTTIIKSWCAAAGMPEPSNGECHALAVALATQVAPAAVAVPDEHEAFEAWATQHAKTRGWLSLVREGESYAGCFSQTAWSAWQARAALSATPAEVQAEPVAIPNDLIESVDAWFAKNTGLGGCSDKDAAELAAIFTAPQAQPADALDAARWRALLACGRIRLFGTAGVNGSGIHDPSQLTPHNEPYGNYVHFGAEFWSTFPDQDYYNTKENPAYARATLTEFADACRAAMAAAQKGGAA